jgi:hypothetical protein
MLAGAAILPTAPLLVPGASPTLPDGVEQVCDAVDATVEGLPEHDLVVLVAGAERAGVYARAEASLSGIGRDDICADPAVETAVARRLAEDTGLPLLTDAPLPLDLAVLVLLLGDPRGVVPLAVEPDTPFADLAGVGAALVPAVEGYRALAVAAGDLAAGLVERSPLHTVDGAGEFDAAVVEAVDAGRLDALARLGPDRARRVGARGWPALATLHGALRAAKLGVVRRHYSAPEGVGYLVAQGA